MVALGDSKALRAARRATESAAFPRLTPRWTALKPHRQQTLLWNSKARFRVVPAGRRSGKTEIAKRFIVTQALKFCSHHDGWFVAAAPTHKQAKQIFWKDLKAMVPKWALLGSLRESISESELTIRLYNGAEITVLGLDQPARIEGRPLDGIVIDEIAEAKQEAWEQHVRPALSTIGRPGWCWFIGVPRGRNHYWRLARKAKRVDEKNWELFAWKSADILDPEEIAQAKRDLDLLTYQQEYEATFLNFEGRAYHAFDSDLHAVANLDYDPDADLILCFDFNVKPGVCAYLQEQRPEALPDGAPIKTQARYTAVIGEVWIPDNSNTQRVCRRILDDWADKHKGRVLLYGDATGGARSTSQTEGSDWDIINNMLRPAFGGRLKDHVSHRNPLERPRVNSVNSRLTSADGTIRMLVDPIKAPHVVDDFDGVTVIAGTAGEIDKKADSELSHISDAIGYYVSDRFPVTSTGSSRVVNY